MKFRMAIVCVMLIGAGLRAQSSMTWAFGVMANLNTAQLSVTSPHAASVITGNQWSAGFGVFARSSEFNRNYLEGVLAFEVTGSAKTIYYSPQAGEWVRIYDRYRTIPLIATINRYVTANNKLSVGIGLKSSVVFSYAMRHEEPLPPASSGSIRTAKAKKWFGAPLLQLTLHLSRADLTLNAWYAVTPLINHLGISANPYGISFGVKYRLTEE